jgi:hypothetical protein
MTFRQTLILLATVLATFGGIATFNAASEQLAFNDCMTEELASREMCAERSGLND